MTTNEPRRMEGIQSDPDIAALTARLGLSQFAYRTFSRPVMAPPAPATAVVPPPPLPVLPVVAQPAPPQSSLATPPAPTHTSAEIQPAQHRIIPIMPIATPPAPTDPGLRFPLLEQVFSGGAATPAPASAHPFLDLRRAVAGPINPAEY